MNREKIKVVYMLGLLMFLAGISAFGPKEKPIDNAVHKPFALVELYTSQGCNSCPPADLALSKLREKAKAEDLNVYALSFHVDYWNRLGWTDPFSDSMFSKRQKDYAKVWNTERVYTPQMIVNGTQAFVGSQQSALDSAIDSAFKTEPLLYLEIGQSRGNAKMFFFDCPMEAEGMWLNIAVTQSGLRTRVPVGENAGKILNNDAVVVHYETIEIASDRGGTFILDTGFKIDKSKHEVIAYIQDPMTYEILAVDAL